MRQTQDDSTEKPGPKGSYLRTMEWSKQTQEEWDVNYLTL